MSAYTINIRIPGWRRLKIQPPPSREILQPPAAKFHLGHEIKLREELQDHNGAI